MSRVPGIPKALEPQNPHLGRVAWDIGFGFVHWGVEGEREGGGDLHHDKGFHGKNLQNIGFGFLR